MKGTIELNGMEFFAHHGCLESEREEGNLFVVDFSCGYDISAAAVTDALEDTLDYSEIYGIIAAQMAVPSRLLEHVAGRIASAVTEAYPGILHLKVKVSKRNPPVDGTCAWSSVTAEI